MLLKRFIFLMLACAGLTKVHGFEYVNSCQFTRCCPHIVAEAEYLLAWRKSRDIPPLLTTSPADTTPNITNPRTDILFGGKTGNSPQSGLRGSLTLWITDRIALAGGGFWINDETNKTVVASNSQGIPSFGIPYFSLIIDSESNFPIALQDDFAGNGTAKTINKVWGGNASLQWQIINCCDRSLNLLVGYQNYSIDDTVTLKSITDYLLLPNVANIDNKFMTNNTFNGGLLGLKAEIARGCWAISLIGQVGLGEMKSKISIDGTGIITPPNGQFIGFVQNSNKGCYHKNNFAAVTEIVIKPSYRINECLQITAGYTLIYWTHVYLAGKQIDRRINIAAPSDFPKFLNNKCDFWLQGLTVGFKASF